MRCVRWVVCEVGGVSGGRCTCAIVLHSVIGGEEEAIGEGEGVSFSEVCCLLQEHLNVCLVERIAFLLICSKCTSFIKGLENKWRQLDSWKKRRKRWLILPSPFSRTWRLVTCGTSM